MGNAIFKAVYDSSSTSVARTAHLLSQLIETPVQGRVTNNLDWEFTVGDLKLTTTSVSNILGQITVAEYFDTETDLILPKANYSHCPETNESHDDLPDARLVEVLGVMYRKLDNWEPYPSGRRTAPAGRPHARSD